ncbi:MAG: OmpA family protein [Candidatus Omnitrophota bacterium]
MRRSILKGAAVFLIITTVFLSLPLSSGAETRQEKRERALKELQRRFEWWPTDAAPGPVRDEERGGYWWWPKEPGEKRPWGNRGYVYVNRIFAEPKQEKFPPPEEVVPVEEKRPRTLLLIKKVRKNVKVYFDYNRAVLREDHTPILEDAIRILQNNPECGVLITGNCDKRGSDSYNIKLGEKRGEAVRQFMLNKGIADKRIRIISRGRLDAMASLTDLTGMQRDRNAHFVVAEVEERTVPYDERESYSGARELGGGRFLIEEDRNLESGVKVSTKNYVIQKRDTLWKIAEREMGSGFRWQYLYQLNRDRIKNPNVLSVGSGIMVPIE